MPRKMRENSSSIKKTHVNPDFDSAGFTIWHCHKCHTQEKKIVTMLPKFPLQPEKLECH